MPFDLTEFEALATKHRALLASQALSNIGPGYKGDVDDVIQTAMIAAWIHRDRIYGPLQRYVMSVVKRIAFQWKAPEGKHQGVKQPDYCQLDYENPVFIDAQPNALELLCNETRTIEELEAVVPTLSGANRRTYVELQSRRYVPGKGHAWGCRMSKLRNALRQALAA